MKTLLALLAALFFSTPLYADQALVLTEIEQIQEKIWYLQRDLAAQKSAIEKQQQESTRLAADTGKTQRDLESRLAAMAQTTASQQEALQEIDNAVQSLRDAVSSLANEFEQQTRTQLQQAEKSGSQEGLLRAMREEFAASRKQTDLALAETQKQLAETREELASLKTNQGESFNQLVLWGGGAALALAILLTIVLATRGGRSRPQVEERKSPTKHEL